MEYTNQTLIILIIIVLLQLITAENNTLSSPVVSPNCSSKCGKVTIPYPFGIEDGCNFVDEDNPDYYFLTQITCNHTANPPYPILGTNIPVSNISVEEGEIWLDLDRSFYCYDQGEITAYQLPSINLVNFTISTKKNILVAIGCDTYAWFTGIRYGEPYYTGCMTKCDELDDVVDGKCNGVGCCQATVPDGVTNLTTTAYSFNNHTNVPFNPCSVAFPVAIDSFVFNKGDLNQTSDYFFDYPKLPVIFNWGIGNKNCTVAEAKGSCLCKKNTLCIDLDSDQDGYRCKCRDGFTGNPYLPQGLICILARIFSINIRVFQKRNDHYDLRQQ